MHKQWMGLWLISAVLLTSCATDISMRVLSVPSVKSKQSLQYVGHLKCRLCPAQRLLR